MRYRYLRSLKIRSAKKYWGETNALKIIGGQCVPIVGPVELTSLISAGQSLFLYQILIKISESMAVILLLPFSENKCLREAKPCN